MMMTKRKERRGGYRPGAGGKPKYGERMELFTTRLPPSIIASLTDLAATKGVTRSAIVLELLAKAHKPVRDAIEKLKRTD